MSSTPNLSTSWIHGCILLLDFHQVGDQVNGSANDSPVTAAPELENGTVVTK